MNRYLNPNPAHIQFLDLVRTQAGFAAYFGSVTGDADGFYEAPLNRARAAVPNGIAALEGLANDTTKPKIAAMKPRRPCSPMSPMKFGPAFPESAAILKGRALKPVTARLKS